jgi:hypothetical protein
LTVPLLSLTGPPKEGVNWYTYVGNNPTVGVDPEGLKLVYVGPWTEEQHGELDQALTYLRSVPWMGAMIDWLTDPKTPAYKIQICSESRYMPTDHKILWNPHRAMRLTNGGTQSPALELAHEVGRAVVRDESAVPRDTPFGRYTNVSEFIVITFIETPTAILLGGNIRADHYGTLFDVPTPLSR